MPTDNAPPSSRPGSDAGTGLPYGRLNAKRPKAGPLDRGYDEKVWQQLTDEYIGGFQIQENAAAYLPKSPDETQARYEARVKDPVAYINYFGRVVGFYAAMVFQEPLSIMRADQKGGAPSGDVYTAFGEDADLQGRSFRDVLREAFTWALVTSKAFVALDFPAPPEGTPVASRADEQALALDRPYAYVMHPEEMLWWEYDAVVHRAKDLTKMQRPGEKAPRVEWSYGRLKWCVTKRKIRERESVEEKPGGFIEEFKVWEKGNDGVVRWATYRTKPLDTAEQKHADEEICERTATGDVTFPEIPVLEVAVPYNLWLGNLIGSLNLEHWRRRSLMVAAQSRAMHAILWVKYGPQLGEVGGSMPSHMAQDPRRGISPAQKAAEKGAVQLDASDDIGFAEPSGAAFEKENTQLKDLGDIIFQLSSQMAGSLVASTTALGRSGASKSEDMASARIVCAAYGEICRDVAVRAWTMISRARDESTTWAAHGMDDFSAPDRAGAIEEATQLGALDIPSPTFRREARKRLAGDILPGLAPAQVKRIHEEIDANISDEEPEPPPPPGGAPKGPED